MPTARAIGPEELLDLLRRRGPELAKDFFRPETDLLNLIKVAVMGNTFRAFHNLQRRPSEIFREWAAARFTPETVAALPRIRSQADFDTAHQRFTNDLATYWGDQGKKPIGVGPAFKLPALLFKSVARWSQLPANRRDQLIQFLPVPLDSYSLLALKECAASGRHGTAFHIPNNATMAFIDSADLYAQVQGLAREVAKEAGVPAVYVDFVAWDDAHSKTPLAPK